MSKKVKILLYDIETTPAEAWVWRKWVNGPVIKIKKDWELLSFSYRWLGEKTTHVYSRRLHTERQLVQKLQSLMGQADITVAHNGWQFDDKKTMAKYFQLRLKPHRPPQQVDTKAIACKHFGFTGNSLEDLAELLGVGKKVKHRGFDMWLECMAGETKALRELETYNKGDIDLLEPIYLELRKWASSHPNVALICGDKSGCPSCGTTKVQRRGLRARGTATILQQWQCMEEPCGRWYTTSLKTAKESKLG